MNLRIISGKYGGRTIQSPGSAVTHPMSEMIRNAIFNIIGPDIKQADVLDAFAGTGSLGIEAISRGASSVIFIERDRHTFEVLQQNISTLGINDGATCVQIGLSTWIEKNQGNFYDIIFADPPFTDTQLSTVTKLLGMLKPNGLMLLSYPGSSEVPSVNGFVVVDNRRYGNAALAIYRRK